MVLMINCFKYAKFGDTFNVNDGSIAIYHCKKVTGSHRLILNDGTILCCKDDGKDYNDGRYIVV